MREKHPFDTALLVIKDHQKVLKNNKAQFKLSTLQWRSGLGVVSAFTAAVYFFIHPQLSEKIEKFSDSYLSTEQDVPALGVPLLPRVEPKPSIDFNYVTTTGLNVRIGPSTNDNIVGVLAAGSCLKSLHSSYRDGWMTFDLTIIDGQSEGSNGLTVYLSEQYLQQVTIPDNRCEGTIRLMPRYNYLGK